MSGLKNLLTLNLSHNNIKELKTGTFFPNQKLTKLIFDNNKIKKIADEIFMPNSCPLKAFFIKENGMEDINGKFLQNCTELRFLFVSENKLKKIPSNLLKDKPVLKTFDASRNQIATIDGKLFSETPELQNFYFNENELEEFPIEILDNKNLKVLDLHKNKIRHMPLTQSRSRGEKPLEILDLRQNDELGELAQLYHSKDSWYAKMGDKEVDTDPLDNLNSANLVKQRAVVRSVDQIIAERRALLHENLLRKAAHQDIIREHDL